jgi:hypothetical protein
MFNPYFKKINDYLDDGPMRVVINPKSELSWI